MKKILYAATKYITLEAFLIPFVIYFKSKGFEVHGMANGISESEICKKYFDNIWEVNWSRNPLYYKNLLQVPSYIKKIVKENKYNIIHVHTPVASFVTRYSLKDIRSYYNFKIIYTAHGFHFHKNGSILSNLIFILLEKIVGRWVDILVVINEEDYYSALKYKITKKEKIKYIPGIGIDLQKYNPSNIKDKDIIKLRKELEIPNNSTIFLMIAEFNKNKRHIDLLKAFSLLNYENVYLLLAGDGPLREKVEELAVKLKIYDRVRFLGYRKDIPKLIKLSNAVILTSQREGLSRSIMEALSLKTPVIGSNVRGIKDLIKDNETGFIFPLKDIHKLKYYMEYVIKNPKKAKEMGERGRKSIEKYEINKILKMYEEVYTQALK